jgi:hypothetical protein
VLSSGVASSMDSSERAGAPWAETSAPSFDIAVFDFISHENMHHAFNEEYIRILRAAFPDDRIVFHAVAGHVEKLARRVADLDRVEFRPCKPLEVPFGFSRHNPVAGRWAAHRCLDAMTEDVAGRSLRFAALLGIDANLLAVIGQRWPSRASAPLHLILHGMLGDTMVWRSRNPFIRAGDFISVLRRPLPRSVRLVALELGVKEAIGEICKAPLPSIITLEHPVLESEWAADPVFTDSAITKIAFLGHARRAKGFEVFANLARSCARPDLEFQAIGLSSHETDQLDVSTMSRKPSPTPLPRDEYVEALEKVDLVCLPLHSRAYDFTASGTVSDAIAALKPLIAFRNRTLDAIVRKYGEIGYLVESRDALFALFHNFDRDDFLRRRPEWIANLEGIREARRPELLAASYAQTIELVPQ